MEGRGFATPGHLEDSIQIEMGFQFGCDPLNESFSFFRFDGGDEAEMTFRDVKIRVPGQAPQDRDSAVLLDGIPQFFLVPAARNIVENDPCDPDIFLKLLIS